MLDKDTIMKWMIEDGGNILFDPKNPQIFNGYVTFTKESAEMALENNTKNRSLNRDRVFAAAEALVGGWWDANVSKINFASDGTLSDGQHRLTAAAETDIPMRVLVTWGVTKNAQRVTDRRGSRILADDLVIDGYNDARTLAALSRLSYARAKGVSLRDMMLQGRCTTKYPDVAVYYYFKGNEERIIREKSIANSVRRQVKALGIRRSIINVLAVEFDKISPDDAASFWTRLKTGGEGYDGDPINLLHNRLMKNALSNSARIPTVVMAALIIKAWNAYEKGEAVRSLRYYAGGDKPEEFPEIYDPNAQNDTD